MNIWTPPPFDPRDADPLIVDEEPNRGEAYAHGFRVGFSVGRSQGRPGVLALLLVALSGALVGAALAFGIVWVRTLA